jgi:multicomponent K+:H+ antiporter subunit C
MEALVAIALGVLTASGIWLMLRARTFDIVLGLTLLSYAVNVFIFAMGRLAVNATPILTKGETATLASVTDPLPQALVLTAIVIGFGMTALLIGVAVASFRARGGKPQANDGADGVDDPEVPR